MRYASDVDEPFRRLDQLIERLSAADIALLKRVLPSHDWLPDKTYIVYPAPGVQAIMELLHRAHRSETHGILEEGTADRLRAHLLARIASPPEEIQEVDPLHDASA